MKQYTVVSPSGYAHQAGARLQMTEDQARRRRHQIKVIGGGVYECIFPVMFKCGETFGMESDVAKSLATQITPVDLRATDPGGAKPRGKATLSAAPVVAARGDTDPPSR